MNVQEIKDFLAAGQLDQVEALWAQAASDGAPLPELGSALETIVAAGQAELAEMLGWTLISELSEETAKPQAALDAVHVMLLAVPGSDELRGEAIKLYHRLHGQREHFEALLKASGLEGSQSPKRALRTLDICLGVVPGSFLANRFDGQVLRAVQYNSISGEFELAEPAGRTLHLEPKILADEFELVDANDFRVLHQHLPAALAKALEDDPAAILIGVCLARGGKIDANELKDMLVPRHMSAEKWSGWWNRARTTARRNSQLSLEGRNPIVVAYYSQGRSLEEELSPAVHAARMPLERLVVLQQYARQLRERKLSAKPEFAGPIMDGLAEQARQFLDERPADALAAALAIRAALDLGLPAPTQPHPSAAEVLSNASRPAQAVAALEDEALWPAALDALAARADAQAQLAALLYLAPISQLDAGTDRLRDAGAGDLVDEAAARGLAEPIANLNLFLWLWKGPQPPVPAVPGKVELLNRILAVVQELDHDWQINAADRKNLRQQIRAALAAGDYASYRQAVSEMNEAVASTFKDRIHRTIGLAQAVREDMINILRESFYSLFIKTRVEPWLDESTIWTTQQALARREALLKEIVEVKMMENARAIGAAAEHGDLSENSEWKFAIEERDMLRLRAAKLSEELAKVRVIHPEEVSTETVGIGSKVTLQRISDGKELELKFLGPWDSDLERNIYSYQTVLAAEIMGKAVGDSINVKFEGMEGEYRIAKIGSAV